MVGAFIRSIPPGSLLKKGEGWQWVRYGFDDGFWEYDELGVLCQKAQKEGLGGDSG
jgi:hypothetical protein